MFARVVVILLNTHREAVRAKVLHGLLALALATAAYCVVVGQFAAADAPRVVSNLGSASVALYGAFVAIVLSATALHRELELKTLFPILARPIGRGEYLVGKYLGTLATLALFVTANSAVFLLALALEGGASLAAIGGALAVCCALVAVTAVKVASARSVLPSATALALAVLGYVYCDGLPDDRRVVVMSAALTLLEVSIIAAVAMVFSSFSSPFLTAVFTLGVFLVGRSADTLAHLPQRMFGREVQQVAEAVSRVVPNLMIYVPERPLLTGEAADANAWAYLAQAAVQSFGWALVLLAVGTLVFRRRDLI